MMRIKIAIWFINIGISILPKEFKDEVFIRNCMATNIIRINN